MNQIRTFILDDDPDAVCRLELLLTRIDEVKICGAETNPNIAIPLIRCNRPEIIFLDVEMPGFSGFDVLELIRSKEYLPSVIFVTAYDRYAIEAIKNSAFDYILKPVNPDELTRTIRKYYTQNGMKNHEANPGLEKLTEREYEIFNLLRVGNSSKQIAGTLNISKNTVDTHRRRILRKLGLHSTTEIHLGFHTSQITH